MGLVNMGPPRELALLLRDFLGLREFIETGTYQGRTAAWAAGQFERVTTIELSRSMFEQALVTVGSLDNCTVVLGDSRNELTRLAGCPARGRLFWLDGHWSGGETYGDGDECPLMEELAAIRRISGERCILIDDARLFLSPPPRPHRIDQWPCIMDVLDGLRALQPDGYTVIHDDCIVCVPRRARACLSDYCQSRSTMIWERRAARPGMPDQTEMAGAAV